MKMYLLRRKQLVAAPLEKVFAFFEKPENLARITPPAMAFQILTPSPITMRKGAVIDYSVRILGIRRHWRTLISEYDPPRRFVDEQIEGPYTFWRHEHRFQEADNGTCVIDTVRYIVPFGILGWIVHPLLIAPQLEKIFNYRKRIIDEQFSTKNNRVNLASHAEG
jgi:ligand-binding SRPBCC domain-containing protein